MYTSENLNKKATKILIQFYEAEFGIQGARIDYLTREELIKSLVFNSAHPLAPRRGSKR